jgi:CIC family chloride channel protein
MNLSRLIGNFLKWRVRHVNEHRFIIFLSIFLGIQIGIIVAILKSLVYFIKDMINTEPLSNLVNYFNFILPILGVTFTVLIIKWFAGGKLNRGIPFVLYVIGRNGSIMRSGHMYMQAITSALTIGFGGSVGLAPFQ